MRKKRKQILHKIHTQNKSIQADMYPSCANLTDPHEFSICDPTRNETEPEPIFDEDLEKIVSMTVFVLFGIIFVVGLIGNALVVIGKYSMTTAIMNLIE